ncbi:uncharacterized protein isoform X1 [Rhodnius prolixus]|uniref:uncharacterized protein isoform X1 n=1 Tax=Rhodnius prolixus TaxID=13249 RepID=UPI003D18A18D
MLITKLIIVLTIFGHKIYLVESERTVFRDIDINQNNPERCDNCRRQEDKGMVVCKKGEPCATNNKRKERNTNTDYYDKASFSGHAVLNENSRRQSEIGEKIVQKKKKTYRRKKMKAVTTMASLKAAVKKLPVKNHRLLPNRTEENKRKIRFIADIERVEPLEPIYKSREFEELRHSYFNGPMPDYNDFIKDNTRSKKEIIPENYIFHGEFSQPQFVDDLVVNEVNFKKRDLNNALKNSETQVICNPEKPSVIVDSVAPKCIHHIDRQIIEEIVQVDIPLKSASTKASSNQSSSPLNIQKTTPCLTLNYPRYQKKQIFKDKLE